MGTMDDTRGSGVSERSSRAPAETDGEGRLTVELEDDLAVSVDAGVEPDAADDASDLEADDETTDLGDDDTSGFAADVHAADADEPPSDAPLGLTSVRLPARGRRRGRPGTIF